MPRYYDVTITDKESNCRTSFWADNFSINEDGILRVYSEECGDVTVLIEAHEELNVSTVDVKDELEETMDNEGCGMTEAEALKIVQEVAKEYGNGWIPCSERLPEEQDEYLVWWTADGFKGKCFYEIVEYHPQEGWIGKIPQAPFGKYTIIAWQPLPAPYQKGE